MIDLHCHILPGVDDGPHNPSGFIEMANAAVSEGITHLFATPHHLNGRYENPKGKILNLVSRFNDYLQQNHVPLTLHAGQELRIHREIFQSFRRDEVLTLDNEGNYLLLELPSGEVPAYTHEIVYELLVKGIQPIIVHPERNREFLESPNLLFELVQEGALTQVTSGSIIGQFGKKVKSFSARVIEHQLAHFISTDAHNTISRDFSLLEAYDSIAHSYGIGRTYFFKENAELLLNGQTLQREKPLPIRKRVFGIF